jgi:anaerobic ribonucleoside-triphosphate reductase activating protein
MRINLAHAIPRSRANGPGERFVVWVQGCQHACPGCWNPDTWSFAPRTVRAVDDLIAEINRTDGIDGVTFTGGEPFAQAKQLALVARAARDRGLGVVVFTGHELDELTSPPARELLALTDLLVAGRFVQERRSLTLPLRGSTNQTLHYLTARYRPADVEHVPSTEIHLRTDGTLEITGFPDVELADLIRGSDGARW